MQLVIGIDVGTQGVRVLVVDTQGNVHAASNSSFPFISKSSSEGTSEQNPHLWWKTTQTCLISAIDELHQTSFKASDVAAISITSTSGTIVPVNGQGDPLSNAIMYNDSRSKEVVTRVSDAGSQLQKKLGYTFKSSFGLPKIYWLYKTDPALCEQAEHFIHATDFIVGKLTGIFNISDHSNSLKTGFDLIDYSWPDFITDKLGIPKDKLPQVVPPGKTIGNLTKKSARAVGLTQNVVVISGVTDGVASQLASGATSIGSWNSILGTTLVIKGNTRELVRDPQGRFYSHLHPQGTWMLGGASNTGGEWITKQFPSRDPSQLDILAEKHIPTEFISYPLVRKGERFPFEAPEAEGFLVGKPQNDIERFAANLEGLAYLERLAYDTLSKMNIKIGREIYVTGGGAKSELWLKIRSSVLSRQLLRPSVSEAAMGAAVLAASRMFFNGDLIKASKRMVSINKRIDPLPKWQHVYDQNYQSFLHECQNRGFIDDI